jgi:hypothetical protein
MPVVEPEGQLQVLTQPELVEPVAVEMELKVVIPQLQVRVIPAVAVEVVQEALRLNMLDQTVVQE